MPPLPLTFPYKVYKGLECPTIPIGLRSDIGWKKVWGYVDSGFIHSILHEGEGQRLRIEIEKGQRRTVKVGSGDIFPMDLHRLEVQVGSERFQALIGFSKDLKVGFNILGRQPFFERLRVCFDDAKKLVSFE